MNETQTPPTENAAEPKLTDHAYDGIQEYDNPTPGWWTWLFIATIGFSLVYFLFVTLAGGQLSPIGFYDRALASDTQRQMGELGELKPDAQTLLKYSKDEKWMKYAGSIFANKCAPCHGADAQGVSGPNLTDEYYIYVKKIEDIADVVTNGRNAGAMPSWRGTLNKNQIVLMSSYVASLRGKNRPGPRGPEGQVIPAWSK